MEYRIELRKVVHPVADEDVADDIREIESEISHQECDADYYASELAVIRTKLRVLRKQRDQVKSKQYEIWQDNDAPQGEYASSSSPYWYSAILDEAL